MSTKARCQKRRFSSRLTAAAALNDLPIATSGGVYRCYRKGCKGAWHISSHQGESKGRRRRW